MAEKVKLECLKKLQEIITEKLLLEEEAEKIPEDLQLDMEALDNAEKTLNDLNRELQKAQDEAKLYQEKYTEADRQSTSYQKLIEVLSTQREYEAMIKQINDAETASKQYLVAMNQRKDSIKSLSAKIKTQSEKCNELKAVLDEKSAKVESELASLNEKIAEKEKECELVRANTISEAEYNKLYSVAKKKGGRGLVPVYGQVCMGCNLVLPLQFVIDLRIHQENDEVGTCPYCSRLIYSEELSPNEEKSYIFDFDDSAKKERKGDVSEDIDDDSDILSIDEEDADSLEDF